jgi:hypothetical protein
MEIEAGYLIVKTYPNLYQEYAQRYKLTKAFYALPRIDRSPNNYEIQYRGLDRDALDPYKDSKKLAEIRMAELEENNECTDGFLFLPSTVKDVLSYLDNADAYEVIWTKIAKSSHPIPEQFLSIGFEPSYFVGDHFSASCDCMLIPRWHGSDEEGTLFDDYFRKLNKYGLFEAPDTALAFLDYYLSFDWTETGEYEIVEVFIKNENR